MSVGERANVTDTRGELGVSVARHDRALDTELATGACVVVPRRGECSGITIVRGTR